MASASATNVDGFDSAVVTRGRLIAARPGDDELERITEGTGTPLFGRGVPCHCAEEPHQARRGATLSTPPPTGAVSPDLPRGAPSFVQLAKSGAGIPGYLHPLPQPNIIGNLPF